MEGIKVIGKIELHKKEDILCPSCGKNCNREGLIIRAGVLQPCDNCLEIEQLEYWDSISSARENYELERQYDESCDLNG